MTVSMGVAPSSSEMRSRSSLLPSFPTGMSSETVSREIMRRFETWSVGSFIRFAISMAVGSRPSSPVSFRVIDVTLVRSSHA